MANVISGILTVPAFTPTATVGEYTIQGASYVTQTDFTSSGAYALHTDMVLYVPALDVATFSPMPGVAHRYRITEIVVIDQGTIDATIIWDEPGDEVDSPSNGAPCIITEVTPNKKLGFILPEAFYPDLGPGVVVGATNSDLINIVDKQEEPQPAQNVAYVHTQNVAGTAWLVEHNKKSTNFVYTIFDDMQSQCFPDDVEIVDENRVVIHLLEDMKGRVIFSFV